MDGMRAGHKPQCVVGTTREPRDDGAVLKTWRLVHGHVDTAALTAQDAHERGVARLSSPDRHEVRQRDTALLRLEAGLKHQCARQVAARHACLAHWCKTPSTMLLVAQQACKARIRIEARPAQPVD